MRIRSIVAALAGLLVLASCGNTNSSDSADETPTAGAVADAGEDGGGADDSGGDADDTAASQLDGTLTIFAAASLKATFDEMREIFQGEHPDVNFPEITYDGSSTLVTQIQQGAPADIFASANQSNMDKLDGEVTHRADFVTNMLQIAVAPGNPKNIESLADLARDDLITVLCAPEVPCGAASHTALDIAGVSLTPASEEDNVKAVLTKVVTGDADAGLVYQTDVFSAAGDVDAVDFPEAAEAVNVYPIAILKDAKNEAAAQAFIDLVLSDQGQAVFAAVGFGQP